MNGVRAFAPTVLVAALGTTFGSALVIAPGIVTEALSATGFAELRSVEAILSVIGWLALGVALYVGAIVTANTCATLIAGQTRIIALQRLVGATGASLRGRITRTGLVVGVLGGLIGAVAGTGLTALFVVILRGNGFLPDTSYTMLPWQLVLPIAAVVLATWGAFGVGSRRVLTVTPLQALSSSVEPSHDDVRSGRGRTVLSVVLIVV
ncbi:FtsX-like permease family protein, partial [Curtobacterium sp. MCBA15_008]